MENFKGFIEKIYEAQSTAPVPLQADEASSLYNRLEKAIKDNNLPQAKMNGTGVRFHPISQIIQAALNYLGYKLPIYGIDGKFGKESAKALVDFKDTFKIPYNGVTIIEQGEINEETIRKIIEVLKEKKLSDRDLKKYRGNSEIDLEDIGESPIVGGIKSTGLSGEKKKNAEIIVSELMKRGVTNPYTIKAILSVVDKESGFNPKKPEIDYSKTSNDRIRKIFGKRMSGLSDSEINKLKRNPETFWDRVYGIDDPTGRGERYGNDMKGDGMKYRGRGYNQLTFKSNYRKYNRLLRQDGVEARLVSQPEQLEDPTIAAAVNAIYFINGLKHPKAKSKYGVEDPNGFKDFPTALKAAVNANAGWGKDIEGSETYQKALASSNKFLLDNIENIA